MLCKGVSRDWYVCLVFDLMFSLLSEPQDKGNNWWCAKGLAEIDMFVWCLTWCFHCRQSHWIRGTICAEGWQRFMFWWLRRWLCHRIRGTVDTCRVVTEDDWFDLMFWRSSLPQDKGNSGCVESGSKNWSVRLSNFTVVYYYYRVARKSCSCASE